MLAGVIGYFVNLPVLDANGDPLKFPGVQIGPDRRELVERTNGKPAIWVTIADIATMRTDREGNVFYTSTPENKKFLEFRFDAVEGLDDLTDRELAERINASIRELQTRTLVAQAASATTVGPAIDLAALGAPDEG